MSTTETNGVEIAQGIVALLEDQLVQPTRFQPNIGLAQVKFNHRRRQIRLRVEAKGNFELEFDVAIVEFQRDPEQAFYAVRKAFQDTHMAAMMRRHDERHTLDKVMQELH